MSTPLFLLTSFVSLICRAPVTELKRVEEKDFSLLYCKKGVTLEPCLSYPWRSQDNLEKPEQLSLSNLANFINHRKKEIRTPGPSQKGNLANKSCNLFFKPSPFHDVMRHFHLAGSPRELTALSLPWSPLQHPGPICQNHHPRGGESQVWCFEVSQLTYGFTHQEGTGPQMQIVIARNKWGIAEVEYSKAISWDNEGTKGKALCKWRPVIHTKR